MNIDLHNHVIPPTIVAALARDPERFGMSIEEKDGKRTFNNHGRSAELQKVFTTPTRKSSGWIRTSSTSLRSRWED